MEPICAALPMAGDVSSMDCGPVYFSDFVVRKDSGLKSPTDLQGTVFAYNDKTSLSGYVCVRYWHAKTFGQQRIMDSDHGPFFQAALRTGGHERSLRAILAGDADVAAIDRCVRSDLVKNNEFWRKAFDSELEVLSGKDLVLGPNPAQPVVISRRIPSSQRKCIREAFLKMDPEVLASMGIRQWLPVDDAYYNKVREMLALSGPKESLFTTNA